MPLRSLKKLYAQAEENKYSNTNANANANTKSLLKSLRLWAEAEILHPQARGYKCNYKYKYIYEDLLSEIQIQAQLSRVVEIMLSSSCSRLQIVQMQLRQLERT